MMLLAMLSLACAPEEELDTGELEGQAYHRETPSPGSCATGSICDGAAVYQPLPAERYAVFVSRSELAHGVTVVIDDGHGSCWDPYQVQDPSYWRNAHPACRWYGASFPVFCNGMRGGTVRATGQYGNQVIVQAHGASCGDAQIGWIDPAWATRDQVKRVALAPGWCIYRGQSGHPAFVYGGAGCGAGVVQGEYGYQGGRGPGCSASGPCY
jgi:hypothetical protein